MHFPRLDTGTTVSQSVIYSTYQGLDQKTSIDAVPVTACRLAILYYSMLCPAVVGFGENFEEFWILESGFNLRGSQWKRTKLAIHCFGNSTMQSMQQTLYITQNDCLRFVDHTFVVNHPLALSTEKFRYLFLQVPVKPSIAGKRKETV